MCKENCVSFKNLVGARKHCSRHVQANRLGSLEIDHQFVFGRRLHRKVCGFLALEDAIDIAGRAPVLIHNIGPI